MRINKGWSMPSGRLLGAFLVSILVTSSPSTSWSQSGWEQSVPPEIVLRFRPRTLDEAARAPRMPATDVARPASRLRTATMDAGPSPEVGTWQPWGPPGLAWHSLVLDSRRHRFLVVGGVLALDPLGVVWTLDPAAGTCAPLATRPGGGAMRCMGAVDDSLRDRLLVLAWSPGAQGGGMFVLDAFPLSGGDWVRVWSGDSLDSPTLAGIAIDTQRDQLALIGVSEAGAPLPELWRVPLANPSAWTKEAVTGSPAPPAVTHGAAVYEPGRDRFDVIADTSPDEYLPIEFPGPTSVWTVNAAGPPAWTAFPPAYGMPEGTARQLALDARLDRLLFVDQQAVAWTVKLADGSAERLDDGGAAGSRDGLAAAFDPLSRRLYVHGGQGRWQVLPLIMSIDADLDASGSSVATGAPTSWHAESPAALGSLWLHRLLLDLPTGRLIAFGGCEYGAGFSCGPRARARSLSASTGWQTIGGSSPMPVAFGQSVCLDPLHHSLLTFGGQRLDGSGALVNELWSLSLEPGGQWLAIPQSGDVPPPLRNTSLICDEPRARYLLMGGDDLVKPNSEVWELRLDPVPTWRRLPLTGDASFVYPALFADPTRGDAWVFAFPMNVYHLTLDADALHSDLVPVTGALPDPRLHASALCFDPSRRRLAGFLARSDDVTFDQVWTAALGPDMSWRSLAIGGASPWDRGDFSIAYEPLGDQLLMAAGYDDNEDYRSDAWALPFTTPLPTPVQIALASTSVDAAGVHLRWQVASLTGVATVERSRDRNAWDVAGLAHASGADTFAFDDAPLAAGSHAGYRLRLASGGHEVVSAAAWVTAPENAPGSLWLAALPPRPGGALAVRFTLPSSAEARLSLMDLNGRRICAARMPAGAHEWTFTVRPSPGIYFAELAQGGERRVARMLAVR
jgi:hypothetical protein